MNLFDPGFVWDGMMIEAFRGWRRKIGVTTLVIGLVFMAAWGRSHFSKDQISLGNDGHIWNKLFLSDAGVGFQRMRHESPFGCFTVINEVVVPYWFVITPLALASVYLLLSKSGNLTPKPTDESVPAE